jgi:regulator of replication initiation timing
VEDGTYFNIRSFALPYGDYRGRFKDNPFILRITRQPRLAAPPQEKSPLTQEKSPLIQEKPAFTQEQFPLTQDDTQLSALRTRIQFLEQENAELARQNLQLRNQGRPVMATEASAEEEWNKALAAAYQSIINAYMEYRRSSGDVPNLERFLNTDSVRNAFPGFAGQIRSLNTEASVSGYREGLTTAIEILEVAIRIENEDTRMRYLQSLAERYQNNENITNFLNILMKRL